MDLRKHFTFEIIDDLYWKTNTQVSKNEENQFEKKAWIWQSDSAQLDENHDQYLDKIDAIDTQ